MKKWKWLALVALLVGAGFLLFLWLIHDPAQKCFDRIQVDRPLEEAESILKEYGFVKDTKPNLASSGAVPMEQPWTSYLWVVKNRPIFISVSVSDNGLVSHKQIGEVGSEQGFFLRLWRKLTGW